MSRRIAVPASGWWWLRLSPATPQGSDRRWLIARVLDGAVQPHGSVAWYTLSAKWLRDAEWVPASPPAGCDPPATSIATESRTPRSGRPLAAPEEEKVGRVAGEIVDVFLGLSDSLAVYYRRHPDDRDELVAAISRIMVKAVR